MAVKYICDICKAETPSSNNQYHLEITKGETGNGKVKVDSIDLCHPCYSKYLATRPMDYIVRLEE